MGRKKKSKKRGNKKSKKQSNNEDSYQDMYIIEQEQNTSLMKAADQDVLPKKINQENISQIDPVQQKEQQLQHQQIVQKIDMKKQIVWKPFQMDQNVDWLYEKRYMRSSHHLQQNMKNSKRPLAIEVGEVLNEQSQTNKRRFQQIDKQPRNIDFHNDQQTVRSDRQQSGEKYSQQARKKRSYKYTNKDAKRLSKLGFRKGDLLFSVEDCRIQMRKQLQKLKRYYRYEFFYKEKPIKIQKGKTMARTIYLKFECNNCPTKNKWTSISGTFQITFSVQLQQWDSLMQKLVYVYKPLFEYHIQIYRTKCRICQQYMKPFIYQTQMDAMRIFFSVIVTSIIDDSPPPKRPDKYYIRQVHWHKSEWCQACKLGRCITQYNIDPKTQRDMQYQRYLNRIKQKKNQQII